MRKLQEFEMFKRLMLDKYQEKLFSSLPKPNLTNLDIRDLADPSLMEKEKSKYLGDKKIIVKTQLEKESPDLQRKTYNSGANGLFYIDKEDEQSMERKSSRGVKSRHSSQTSRSESEPDSDEELRCAYNDLKRR